VLQPFLMGKAVELHPLAVFLGVAAGAMVAGIAGALFSIPLIAFVNATLLYVVGRDPSPDLGQDEAGAEHFAALSGRRPAPAAAAGERKRPATPALPSARAAAQQAGIVGATAAAGGSDDPGQRCPPSGGASTGGRLAP